MMNYQTPVGVRHSEDRERWPADEGAGPLATLGVFALFVVGLLLLSLLTSQFRGGVYVVLIVPPLSGVFIAYRLRSWWWVLYTTFPAVAIGIPLLFGSGWTTAIGTVLISLGVINAAVMTIATVVAQSLYRKEQSPQTDPTAGRSDQKGTIPPRKNPLMEW